MAAMASRRESAQSRRLFPRPVYSRCVGRHHGTPSLVPRRVPGGRPAASRPWFGQLLARKSADLTIEPCRDWEKLAELFRRHRSADRITTDRSATFLQWRYGPSSQNHPFDICVFRDQRGNEGWFSLGSIIREPRKPIRGCVLLDAIWPREKMSFRDILPAILQRVASTADAILFQPRPGLDYGECSRWVIPCRSEAPKVFAIPRKGGAPLAAASLDLVPADGDGYF